jgi:hypothetical protein
MHQTSKLINATGNSTTATAAVNAAIAALVTASNTFPQILDVTQTADASTGTTTVSITAAVSYITP